MKCRFCFEDQAAGLCQCEREAKREAEDAEPDQLYPFPPPTEQEIAAMYEDWQRLFGEAVT